MHPTLLENSQSSQILQDAELSTMADPLAAAAGVSLEAQNMAAAKNKLESNVRDLLLSVDNHSALFKTAQAELSDIDQKVGALQSRISMAKVRFYFDY